MTVTESLFAAAIILIINLSFLFSLQWIDEKISTRAGTLYALGAAVAAIFIITKCT